MMIGSMIIDHSYITIKYLWDSGGRQIDISM